jgi:hypothetical protein
MDVSQACLAVAVEAEWRRQHVWVVPVQATSLVLGGHGCCVYGER